MKMSEWLRYMCSQERCEPKRTTSRLFLIYFFSMKVLPFTSNTRNVMRERKRQPEIYPSVGAGLKVMIPWQSSYLSCTGVFAMSKFLRKPGQCSCPIRVLKSTIPGLAAALGTGFSLPGAVRCRFAGCRCGLFALASAGRFRAGCVSGHQGDNETLMFLKILIWKGWWMWKAGINVLEAEPASMARFEFWLLGELVFDSHNHI